MSYLVRWREGGALREEKVDTIEQATALGDDLRGRGVRYVTLLEVGNPRSGPGRA